MGKKRYKLRKDLSINHSNTTLYRIEAIEDIGYDIKRGDLGGYIESENNLHHNAWVYDDAMVFGNARVELQAKVKDYAKVFGNAHVSDNAIIFGEAKVSGNAIVHERARIGDEASVYGKSIFGGECVIKGRAFIGGNTSIHGDIYINKDIYIQGDIKINKKSDMFFMEDSMHKILVTLTGIVFANNYYKDLKDFKKRIKVEGPENGYTPIELKYLNEFIRKTIRLLQCF